MKHAVRKRPVERRTELGLELEQAARDILAHVNGEKHFPSRKVSVPNPVDVKEIRESAKMSQSVFAKTFCINPRTLQDWEQGRRKPDTTTRAYLAVIAHNRKAVVQALQSGSPQTR